MSRFTQFIGHCYQEYCLHSSESECNKNVHENLTTMQDHSIKVHKNRPLKKVFLRSLNNLHVLSNVGFYIDGLVKRIIFYFFNAFVTLFIGVSPGHRVKDDDRKGKYYELVH